MQEEGINARMIGFSAVKMHSHAIASIFPKIDCRLDVYNLGETSVFVHVEQFSSRLADNEVQELFSDRIFIILFKSWLLLKNDIAYLIISCQNMYCVEAPLLYLICFTRCRRMSITSTPY